VAENAQLRVFRVPNECEGMRLDRFLPTQLRSTSRTRAQLIIQNCAYSIDGRRLRPSDRVRAEEYFAIWRPAFEEPEAPADLNVLYEDRHLLVIDKPPLMTVHPTARHFHHTVTKCLERMRPGEYFSLVHRLDRDTSGVLLVARSREAASAFKSQLEERSITCARAAERGEPPGIADKTYLAITHGVPPEGLIDLPLEDDPSPLRVKMRVAERGGMASRTAVTVLEKTEKYALIRCDLHTGRQHQIRVHLAHLGTPIVGDKLYGPDERLLARASDNELTEADLELLEHPRHALHASEYRIKHCFTGEPLAISSPLPPDLAAFWNERRSDRTGWSPDGQLSAADIARKF
jgi:23S rRNA pseudouridine1911/1915/1917 synthase